MAKGGKREGAGRKPGAPNKKTVELADRIKEVCGEDFDPVIGMALLAKDEIEALNSGSVVDPEELREAAEEAASDNNQKMTALIKRLCASKGFALDALKEVAPYVHAKRKAVELTGEGGGPLDMNWTIEFVKAADEG